MDKNTLIILPGWDHSSTEWSTFKEMSARDLKTIVVDLPGFGKEPLVSGDWSIPEYADWVIAKVKNIEGSKILLGHSFGGKIASFIASGNPPWLSGLILYGAPSLRRPSLKIKIKIVLAKISKFLKIKKLPLVQNRELGKADTDGLGKIFRNTVPFDQTKLLPKIKVQTLLVWGENDTAVPLHIAKEMKKLIPKSELKILASAGHNAHLQNTYLFYGIIKNFIQNI